VQLDVTLNELTPVLNLAQASLPEAAVIGGIRKNVVVLYEPTIVVGAETRVIIDSNTGTYRVKTNSDLESFALSYGDGPNQTLDLDLTDYRALRIDIISSATLSEASIGLRSGDGEPQHKWVFLTVTVPASDAPYSLIVPFSGLVRAVDLSDIDFIELAGGGLGGFDLVLGGIFFVPEPSTTTLLITAVLTLLTPRRFRRH